MRMKTATQIKKYFGAMTENLEMNSLLKDTRKWLPSTSSGSEIIDHVELSGIDNDTVVRRGKINYLYCDTSTCS